MIKNKPAYSNYLPDEINLNNLTKSFLFNVSIFFTIYLIATIEPQIYTQLYEIYKQKESQKTNKKWQNYEVKIPSNTANQIAAFRPTNR